jgi:hypothetical protein
MESLKTKIEVEMAKIRAENAQSKLQARIAAKVELQQSLKNPIRGKGSQILLRLAEGLKQSGNLYAEATTPQQAAGKLLELLSLHLGNGEHNLVYLSDSSLLISIDGQYYEITGRDMKDNALKFARIAGVPPALVTPVIVNELVAGIIEIWKKLDPNYTTGSRLVR